MEKMPFGEFCRVFGINPRNRIIEFFLEMRELDFSIGDVAKETKLSRATAYNVIEDLLEKGYLIPTRKVSGGQLYKLNVNKEEVKILIKAFNFVLSGLVREYENKRKEKVYA